MTIADIDDAELVTEPISEESEEGNLFM